MPERLLLKLQYFRLLGYLIVPTTDQEQRKSVRRSCVLNGLDIDQALFREKAGQINVNRSSKTIGFLFLSGMFVDIRQQEKNERMTLVEITNNTRFLFLSFRHLRSAYLLPSADFALGFLRMSITLSPRRNILEI